MGNRFNSPLKDGFSYYKYNENVSYEGHWLDHKKHGYGEMKIKNTTFTGEWKNNNPVNGKLQNENYTYEGDVEWEIGYKHYDILNNKFLYKRTLCKTPEIYSNTRPDITVYENSHITPNGNGVLVLTKPSEYDIIKYEGNWVNGVNHGFFIAYDTKNNKFKQSWNDGVLMFHSQFNDLSFPNL